ncbi:hypothetical protein HNQ53_000995 [Microbulbifer hydrolyticus]|uniref:Uncharacterized protein n=1 Tax=Microbulbifer hydrolyticus TaxID=48074 RepID=A0AA89PTF2_9GAMM|nr:hypothetical protein [Microbulbifer hydrolyticus]
MAPLAGSFCKWRKMISTGIFSLFSAVSLLSLQT